MKILPSVGSWIRLASRGQLLPTAKEVNSSKGEFFGVVAGLKAGLMEFSHPLDQSGQARCHRRLAPFVFDERGELKLVHPLQFNMHIQQKPLLLRVLSGALEGGINVLLTAVMTE
jgi:hypothetical protein